MYLISSSLVKKYLNQKVPHNYRKHCKYILHAYIYMHYIATLLFTLEKQWIRDMSWHTFKVYARNIQIKGSVVSKLFCNYSWSYTLWTHCLSCHPLKVVWGRLKKAWKEAWKSLGNRMTVLQNWDIRDKFWCSLVFVVDGAIFGLVRN